MAEAAATTSSTEGKKIPWSAGEDETLRREVQEHGTHWSLICQVLPSRSAKACRLRWCNHLSPELDSSPFSPEEDAVIVEKQGILGNRWAAIALHLPGRCDNAVKNRWNYALSKRLHGRSPTDSGEARSSKRLGSDASATAPECLELFPLTRGDTKKPVVPEQSAFRSLMCGAGDPMTELVLGLDITRQIERPPAERNACSAAGGCST